MGTRYRFVGPAHPEIPSRRDKEYIAFMRRLAHLGTEPVHDITGLYSEFVSSGICCPETKERGRPYVKATLRMHLRSAIAEGLLQQL